MRIIQSAEEMRAACRQLRAQGRTLGLVPTMGALHEGHLALVRAARGRCDEVAVSVFVNPLQFAPNEDYARYPRSPERDRQLLEAERVTLLFMPSAEEMYPAGAKTFVRVEGMSDRLCGRSRPGHFRGVTTIVAKLLQIVQPNVAFFGQKDAAQVAIIRRMVQDLDFDVEIVVTPTVREKDGLAMSSRNAYLTPDQRRAATVLYRALMRVQFLVDRGESDAGKLISAAREVFKEEPLVRVDYIEVVDPESLEPLDKISGGALAAMAAFVGDTRLIDNVMLYAAGTAAPSVEA